MVSKRGFSRPDFGDDRNHEESPIDEKVDRNQMGNNNDCPVILDEEQIAHLAPSTPLPCVPQPMGTIQYIIYENRETGYWINESMEICFLEMKESEDRMRAPKVIHPRLSQPLFVDHKHGLIAYRKPDMSFTEYVKEINFLRIYTIPLLPGCGVSEPETYLHVSEFFKSIIRTLIEVVSTIHEDEDACFESLSMNELFILDEDIIISKFELRDATRARKREDYRCIARVMEGLIKKEDMPPMVRDLYQKLMKFRPKYLRLIKRHIALLSPTEILNFAREANENWSMFECDGKLRLNYVKCMNEIPSEGWKEDLEKGPYDSIARCYEKGNGSSYCDKMVDGNLFKSTFDLFRCGRNQAVHLKESLCKANSLFRKRDVVFHILHVFDIYLMKLQYALLNNKLWKYYFKSD